MPFLALLSIGLLLTEAALACSCIPSKNTAEAWKQADAVFAGRVLTLKKTGTQDRYATQVDFEVIEPWKGISEKRVSVRTGQSADDCGYPFKSGQRYLVFAFGTDDLKVDTCTRTVELEVAKPDVKYLKKKVLAEAKFKANPASEKKLFWEFHKKDLSSILQMILDDERLDRYFKVESKPDRKPLVVLTNKYTKQIPKLQKFGEPVRFLERRKTNMKTPLFDFSEITFEKDSALVRFFYTAENVRGEVGLQKADAGWRILRYDLIEQ